MIVELSGLASAHGHSFQRALRGRTQGGSAFWSWRGLMYALAERLGPDELYAIARFAYAEMAAAGFTAVGEFHYLHHQPGGAPYAERTLLADAVVRAARDAGLRITLLRVLYARGGFGRPLEPAQRRFCDARVEDALADVATLRTRWAGDAAVRVGIAPHSVRAVPIEWIEDAARFAAQYDLPMHMHVSEQRREVQESLAEHGRRPVQLLVERGVLSSRFCAVHATHLAPDEVAALAGSFVCVCRTTERDLGDGAPPLGLLVSAGARLCVGVDSHALADPFEEARAAELDERTRTEARARIAPARLLEALGAGGYAALGHPAPADRVLIDMDDLALEGGDPSLATDSLVFAGSPRAVREVWVGPDRIVESGEPRGLTAVRAGYRAALARLGIDSDRRAQ